MKRNGSQDPDGLQAGHPRDGGEPPAAARDLDLDAFLPYLVNVLANRLSTELADIYEARFGISIPEWRVIAHLASHRRVSVREIYARVAMDKVKVSRAAASLEAAGHVRKEINASDRRLVSLELTPKGRRLYLAIVPLALDFEERTLAVLTPDERAAFRVIVGKLLGHAGPGPGAEELP